MEVRPLGQVQSLVIELEARRPVTKSQNQELLGDSSGFKTQIAPMPAQVATLPPNSNPNSPLCPLCKLNLMTVPHSPLLLVSCSEQVKPNDNWAVFVTQRLYILDVHTMFTSCPRRRGRSVFAHAGSFSGTSHRHRIADDMSIITHSSPATTECSEEITQDYSTTPFAR